MSCVVAATALDVTHSYASCYVTNEWVMLRMDKSRHVWVSHGTCHHVTWLIHVWRDWFIFDVNLSCMTWRIRMWHDSSMFDMTHADLILLLIATHVCRDLFTCDVIYSCVTWFIHDLTHACLIWLIHMRRDSCRSFVSCHCSRVETYVTWLFHIWYDSSTCDMPHLYAE